MFVAGGGGSGGSFVGLNPEAAERLRAALHDVEDRAAPMAWRIGAQLAEAGPDGRGATSAGTLRMIGSAVATADADLRWRIDLLRQDGIQTAGGMLIGSLAFPSAAAAAAAGRRHGAAMKDALHDGVYGDGDAADEVMQTYFALVREAGLWADDPAWSGGLIEALGSDGISNVVWFSMDEVQGDVEQSRALIAPIAQALATAMRAGTAPPEVRRDLLYEPNYRLGVLLTSAQPETDFLVAAARSRFVSAAWTPDLGDDLLGDEAAFFLQALAGDAEASYRVLTGVGPADVRNAVHLLQPLSGWGNHEAEAALGRVLHQGLVAYPAAQGVNEWNVATETTADVVTLTARMKYLLDDLDPALSTALLGLLRPHLDAVAVIGVEHGAIDPGPYELDVALPGGRRALEVDPDDLELFLGGVLQQEDAITQMQALIAGYAQSEQVQTNRLPLIAPDGRVADLEPFMADSLRIAGLIGLAGTGLEVAGHDEESRTRFLTGSLQFVSKQGINKVVGWTGPLGFVAKQTAGRGAAWAVDRFSDWVAGFEPVEGEQGVDALLEAFSDNTAASLRQHMDTDPAFRGMTPAEQEETLAHATRIAGDMVRAQLLTVYADMVGETAGE